MNRRFFWKSRKTMQFIIFQIKKIAYQLYDGACCDSENASFREKMLLMVLRGIVKSFIVIRIICFIDYYIIGLNVLPLVDKNIFSSAVVGGVGVAGVILGLYCSNLSSVYTANYADAPTDISTAFREDYFSRKCIIGIFNYIIFDLMVLLTIMLDEVGWLIVFVSFIYSIIVVVTYSLTGNRAYQLSDVFATSDYSYRELHRIVTKKLNHFLFATDYSFQQHFLTITQNRIRLLNSILKYYIDNMDSGKGSHAPIVEFMEKNLVIVSDYWKNKGRISRSSEWFRQEMKYQKWHLSNNVESSLALRTGTALRTKGEKDYWWLEDELFGLNKCSLEVLFREHDYGSVYTYLDVLKNICSVAIEKREISIYVKHIDWVRKNIEETADICDLSIDERKIYAGIIELISVLYLNLILESKNIYSDYDFDKLVSSIIDSIDSRKSLEKNELIRHKDNAEYYEKIITEIEIEGKRITPDWVIKQQVALEEYMYLNSLLYIIRESVEHVLNLGKTFYEKKYNFEACIIFCRFYEYESKIENLIGVVQERKTEFEKYHIDKFFKWDEFQLTSLQNSLMHWKEEIPGYVSNSSSCFAIENWNNKDDYPDYLGESFNHICKETIEAIGKGDVKYFEINYESLTKIILLYQQYIKTDLVNRSSYRIDYTLYLITYPIVEWAQLGGLAIIWGEIFSNSEWKKCVEHCSKTIFEAEDGKELAQSVIECVQHRTDYLFGLAGRGIVESEWQLFVVNAIRKCDSIETEYGVYGERIKTNSKIIDAFCPGILDCGIVNDPDEVFWIVCVNPLLPKEKRFRSRLSWEDKLND